MTKPLVPDAPWVAAEPLPPPERPKPKGGRPRADDRAALAHKGSPPALPGWQKQFDVSGSRPPFKVPPREPPRTRRNFDDGRVREPKSHEVGVQMPCRVHSQGPPEDPLWRAETASG